MCIWQHYQNECINIRMYGLKWEHAGHHGVASKMGRIKRSGRQHRFVIKKLVKDEYRT